MSSRYLRGEPVARGGAPDSTKLKPRVGLLAISVMVAAAMAVASWATILLDDRFSYRDFFTVDTLTRAGEFGGDLLGADPEVAPAFFRQADWARTGMLAAETLGMSVAAAGLAGLGALATLMFGARNVMLGSLAPYHSAVWVAPFLLVRAAFTLSGRCPSWSGR